MKFPFPLDSVLTAIAIAYRNPMTSYIADLVLPRVPVGAEEFRYLKHTLADGFTVPDTRIGRKSEPNQVDFSATEVTAKTTDYGLDDLVPQQDIDAAPPNYNPLGRAIEGVTDLILLDREIRAAGLVFNAANYAAANKVTLSGTSQWSDPASDPIAAVMEAMDTMVIRPTHLVLGRAVWTKLRRHAKVVETVLATGAGSNAVGQVAREQVAEVLELQGILVGEGWVNSAKKGQAASLARVWGKHASLACINPQADTNRGMTFGLTAQFGTRIAGQIPEPKKGLRGSTLVRAGESVVELLTANDLGYLFTNAVA
jgi:hypothetical protein